MQNSYSEKTVVYAGFWVRFAAFLIDSLIVGAALLIVRLALFFGFSVFELIEVNPLDTKVLFSYTVKDIILYLAGAAYYIICTYCAGTTAGKWLFNLRVVPAGGSGQRKLRLIDVVYRETIGKFLSGLVMNIGYIIAGMDSEKRALHDMLCDTRVIYAKRVKVIPVRPGQYAYTPPGAGPQNMTPGPGNMAYTQNTPGPGNVPHMQNAPGPGNVPHMQNAPGPGNMPHMQNVPGPGNVPYMQNERGQGTMPHTRNMPGQGSVPCTQNMTAAQNADNRQNTEQTHNISASQHEPVIKDTAVLQNLPDPQNTRDDADTNNNKR